MNRRVQVRAIKTALEHVYAGDQSVEAEAVMDALEDAGLRLAEFGRPVVDVELPGMSA